MKAPRKLAFMKPSLRTGYGRIVIYSRLIPPFSISMHILIDSPFHLLQAENAGFGTCLARTLPKFDVLLWAAFQWNANISLLHVQNIKLWFWRQQSRLWRSGGAVVMFTFGLLDIPGGSRGVWDNWFHLAEGIRPCPLTMMTIAKFMHTDSKRLLRPQK